MVRRNGRAVKREKNMNKRKRKPIAVDISNWGGRSIVYECPNCHTSFRLMGDKEFYIYRIS